MFHEDHNAPPVNPLPPVVWVFSLAIAAIELVLQGAERGFIGGPEGIGWRIEAFTSYAFFDTVFSWMMETGRYPFEHMIRFVSYAFVHANFGHTVFAFVMLLAIGKMVAEAFSQTIFIVIFVLSTIVGAITYGLFLDTSTPLIGAFPAVYGMIGSLTFMLWIKAKVEGTNQFRAFSLIGFLMGIQLFFKLVFGGSDDWVADIGGFVTGLLLSFLLAPGEITGIADVLKRIRRR